MTTATATAVPHSSSASGVIRGSVIASEELPVLIRSNFWRASTSAIVPSSGHSAVSTDGDTATFLESDLFVYALYGFVRQL